MKGARILVGLFFLVVVAISTTVLAKDLSPEQMLQIGGNRIKAPIVRADALSIFVQGDDGSNLEFLYSNGDTKFLPEDYRPSVGDVVDVIYFTPLNASGSDLKSHAMYIGLLESRYNIEVPLNEWIEGIISYPKFTRARSIYLPKFKRLVAVEGNFADYLAHGYNDFRGGNDGLSPGDKILIKLKAVPQNPGASNVFFLLGLKLKE